MSEGPGINSKAVEDDLKLLADLIRDGELWSVDPSTLTRLLNALCIAKTGTSSCALHIVQGLVVDHEQMVRHLTKLDAANARTQKWFMVLAVASIIAAAVQVVCDVRSELRSVREERLHPSVPADSDPRIGGDTQQHEAARKVDPTKSTPPPANE